MQNKNWRERTWESGTVDLKKLRTESDLGVKAKVQNSDVRAFFHSFNVFMTCQNNVDCFYESCNI